MKPAQVKLRKSDGSLSLTYPDGSDYNLSAEYLRVHSPSAEVRGHGPGQETLQFGKRQVRIIGIEPAGHYAIKLRFDDGHDSGIYTWDYLRELSIQRDNYWSDYLQKLLDAGKHRDADIQSVKIMNSSPGKTS
ncbi:MAG: gamma-butyrobetaine hydroxylase-like domain-containing protein [bacterium]